MDVRAGYKQTEVGVIPEDWEVKYLGDIGTIVRGGSPRPAGDARFFNGSFIPWLTVGSLTNIPVNQQFVTDTATKLTKEGSKRSRTLQRGTLVIVNSGAKTLGVSKVLGITCCANDGIAALMNQSSGEKRFLCYFLNSQIQRLREVVAAGNDQLNLNTGRIALIAVPFPLEKEQRAIAEALTDVDGLLGGLDRLIAKKRDLKQAAMQQLLTGQTRLPGFRGEWEVKRLGDVTEMGSGGTPPSSVPAYYDGDIPWVSISDMTKGGKVILSTDRNLTSAGFTNSAAQMFPAGTILYAMYASLGECSIAGIPLCSSQAILGIRPKQKHSGEYLYYFLTSLKGIVKTLGQQGTQANLNKGMVQDFRLSLPSLPEQIAIAEVLTEMDAELTGLEQRREKIRALKQAMMQELLTGRTRLL